MSALVLNNMMTCKDALVTKSVSSTSLGQHSHVVQLETELCLSLQVFAAMDGLKDAAKKMGDGVKDAADKVDDGVKDAAEETGDGVKDAAEEVGDGVEDAADKAGDVTKEASDKTKEGVKIIDDNFNLAGDITEIVAEIAEDPEAMAEIAAGAAVVTCGAITMYAGQPVPGAALIMSGTTVIVQVIWSKVDDGKTTFQLHKDVQGESDDIKQGLVDQAVKKFGEAVREAFSEYLKV